MPPAKTRVATLFLATLVFFVMLSSSFFVASSIKAFLQDELHPLDYNQFLFGLIAAFFAALLILALYWRTRQLTAKLEKKEFLLAKHDVAKTLNAMTEFVSIHDKNFQVIKVNQALCEFLNRKPEEIIGKPCYQVFHNMDKPYANCPHRKTSEIEHPVTEIINDPYIGVPLQITCSPFVEDGVFHGSVHVARVSEEINNPNKISAKVYPICASCKSIRNGKDEWIAPEEYFIKKHNFEFTHTFCKECREKLYPGLIKS